MTNNLRSTAQKFWSSPFLRFNIISFVGAMSVSFFNYLYYPILGRLMDLESFGEVQALVSLFLQAAIFLSAMNMVVVNVVANHKDEEQLGKIIRSLEKLTLYIVLGGVGLGLLLVGKLQSFLQFESVYPFIGLMAAILVGVPLMFRNAYLQGTHDFTGFSVGGVITAIGKLVVSASLVLWGWRSFGAIIGILIGQLIALGFVAQRARRRGFKGPLLSLRSLKLDIGAIKPELNYGLIILVVTFITTFLFSGDMIVVKHYFSAEEAGAYAGIATIARIIFFATSSIAAVLLATVKLGQSDVNRRIMSRSLLLLLLIGGLTTLLFTLAPQMVVSLLMGNRYLSYAGLLPQLSLAILLISAINLLFYYLLALRQKISAVIAVVGAGATGVFMIYNHATFWAVIHNLFYGSILILLMLIVWGLRVGRRAFY